MNAISSEGGSDRRACGSVPRRARTASAAPPARGLSECPRLIHYTAEAKADRRVTLPSIVRLGGVGGALLVGVFGVSLSPFAVSILLGLTAFVPAVVDVHEAYVRSH